MKKTLVILASINFIVFVITKVTGGSMCPIIFFDIMFIWYKLLDNEINGKR